MSNSFEKVRCAMELILSIDEDAQVMVVDQEWCIRRDGYIYVYNGEDWYSQFSVEEDTLYLLDEGFMQMLDDHTHCGGYTALLPNNLEIPYSEFKVKYGQGSLL